jgi:hypothetical protein
MSGLFHKAANIGGDVSGINQQVADASAVNQAAIDRENSLSADQKKARDLSRQKLVETLLFQPGRAGTIFADPRMRTLMDNPDGSSILTEAISNSMNKDSIL